MTEGLITGTNKTVSVFTYYNASHASTGPNDLIKEIKTTNKNTKILIGTGYVKATCQVATFEYILNVEKELVQFGVRDKVDLTWVSNEYFFGDFGIDGMLLIYGNNIVKSIEIVEMVFEDRDIKWILGPRINRKTESHIMPIFMKAG